MPVDERAADVDPRVERTRERVFASVMEVLVEEGLDAVNHTRIADVAGVGRATLYRHWPDLASLLVDALRSGHGIQDRAIDADVLAGMSLRDGARSMVATFATVLREDPMVPVMLALLERAERDEDYAEVREQMSSMEGRPMDLLLDAAKARGELPADLDNRLAKAQLAGPLFFLRFVVAEPLDDGRIDAHVDGWLRAIGHTERPDGA